MLAWQVIERFAVIAAQPGGEDSAGRARMDLQSPQEVVNRAFAIADAFVTAAEQRGEIRRPLALEDRLEQHAALLAAQEAVRYGTKDWSEALERVRRRMMPAQPAKVEP